MPEILGCADCDSPETARLLWDVLDDTWQVHCAACGYTAERAYTDAVDAIAAWNKDQGNAR